MAGESLLLLLFLWRGRCQADGRDVVAAAVGDVDATEGVAVRAIAAVVGVEGLRNSRRCCCCCCGCGGFTGRSSCCCCWCIGVVGAGVGLGDGGVVAAAGAVVTHGGVLGV